MSKIKRCKICGEIMYAVNPFSSTSINNNHYMISCQKCGNVEIAELKSITMSELGNHIQCPFCEDKDKQILDLQNKNKELEEKLKNVAGPKFKYHQPVFWINIQTNGIPYIVERYKYMSENEKEYIIRKSIKYEQTDTKYIQKNLNSVFATKEQAEAELKRIKGE